MREFLAPLQINRIWGVGKVAASTFEKLGIRTIGQLRSYSGGVLRQHFGSSGEHFLQLANGIDERPVVSEHEAKSVSNETTFAVDITDPAVLQEWLHALTEQVAHRLRVQGLKGRTVQLKVRFADFTTLTRAQSLPAVTDITAEIWQVVQHLFSQRLPMPLQPVRLVGVGVSNFGEEEGIQEDLFASQEKLRQRKLDSLLDEMHSRFGKSVVSRGKLPGGH